MLNTLVSHNADIRRLVEKGYALSLDSNYLIVRDVPYLDQKGLLKQGAIVSKLVFVDQVRVQPEDHQVFFCGSHPHQSDGTPIRNLGGGVASLSLQSDDLVVQRSFSNKPKGGFTNLFDKIESYVTIISGPAMQIYDANPLTFRTREEIVDSVFKIRDTLTSRAEIGDLSQKFKDDIIAIIGLGGTGAYVLDFLAKTPVQVIRAFDLDWFHVHNAFRSPGQLDLNDLGKRKGEVYQRRYENFRNGIIAQGKFILADSEEDLTGVTFAFVCVDKGTSRAGIIDLLIHMKIPFIDVGMGLGRDKETISGTLRTTFFSPENAQENLEKKLVPLTDPPEDVYHNNIQIGELNALNACIAVIKYKQIRGFYADDNLHHQILFTLDSLYCARE